MATSTESNPKLTNYLDWLRQRGLPESAAFRIAVNIPPQLPAQATEQPASREAELSISSPTIGFIVSAKKGQGLTQAENELMLKIVAAVETSSTDVALLSAEGYAAAYASKSAILKEASPKVGVVFGEYLAKQLLGPEFHFASQRSKLITHWKGEPLTCPLIVTFHPRDMLRFPANKKIVWQDLQFVNQWIKEFLSKHQSTVQ